MGTAWNKLKTVMRGQARVSMERLVDANDMLLLDQQLYETEHALRDARRQLARLKAEQKRNRERSEQLTRQQEHYEAGARQAMAHEEEGLALDIVSRATNKRIRLPAFAMSSMPVAAKKTSA
jgi:phage shock protein A